MGFVVLNGLFEPGTSVELFRVADERAQNASQGIRAGRRLVDADGQVGFDGLEANDRFIAVGFDIYGQRVEVRCRALFPGDGTELAQPPIRPTPQPVGTQEQVPAGRRPAAPAAILQSGVPSGVPSSAAQAA